MKYSEYLQVRQGERVHACHECNHRGAWGDTWSWYGSIKDLDDNAVKKFCSQECATAWAMRENVSSPHRIYANAIPQ